MVVEQKLVVPEGVMVHMEVQLAEAEEQMQTVEVVEQMLVAVQEELQVPVERVEVWELYCSCMDRNPHLYPSLVVQMVELEELMGRRSG